MSLKNKGFEVSELLELLELYARVRESVFYQIIFSKEGKPIRQNAGATYDKNGALFVATLPVSGASQFHRPAGRMILPKFVNNPAPIMHPVGLISSAFATADLGELHMGIRHPRLRADNLSETGRGVFAPPVAKIAPQKDPPRVLASFQISDPLCRRATTQNVILLASADRK